MLAVHLLAVNIVDEVDVSKDNGLGGNRVNSWNKVKEETDQNTINPQQQQQRGGAVWYWLGLQEHINLTIVLDNQQTPLISSHLPIKVIGGCCKLDNFTNLS
jgi:hypothetical protein